MADTLERSDVERMIVRGEPLKQIERSIGEAQGDSEEKAALWLLAYSQPELARHRLAEQAWHRLRCPQG